MASYNAITLEQRAIKREKIERRRGPKPVRTSLLWAQTSWLEAKVALCDGRVVFQSDTRTWNFDGDLLERTGRALDKLTLRPLCALESARLRTRRRQWVLWNECASLENLTGADLRARLVLESLLDAPLTPSAAREFCRLPLRQQNALLQELQSDYWATRTHEFMRWIARNRAHRFWQENSGFPVGLVSRLGFEGDVMSTLLQGQGELLLSQDELVALLETHSAERVRQIAQFWSEARWEWPSVRPLCVQLRHDSAGKLSRDWHDLEDKWRANWVGLWRDMARENLDAVKSALQLHELLASESLARWHETIHKSSTRDALIRWFGERNQNAFDQVKKLCGQSNAASLIEFFAELWLEYSDDQTEGFWHGTVLTSLQIARLLGIEKTRQMRKDNFLYLVRRCDKNSETLQLAWDWARRGESGSWLHQLSRLPLNGHNVALLRREADKFFVLMEGHPDLDAPTRGTLWDNVLSSEEKYAFNPVYWRLVREMASICLDKMKGWHASTLSNLGEWLTLWASRACDFSWNEPEALRFCGQMLAVFERKFKVTEETPERLGSIDSALETFMHLSHYAGEKSEGVGERCEELLLWLTHGKDDRTDDWGDAWRISRRLARRPRLARALLVVARRSPGTLRDLLPQIDVLRQLRLTDELDALEVELVSPTGELGELAVRFPALATSFALLSEWQHRTGDVAGIPAGIRELLGREEKWRREAEFLRTRLVESPNDHLQIRLVNLENRLQAGATGIERELADALQNAVELAVTQGVRALITRSLRGRLRALCGSVVDALEWNDDWANALLLACESEENRKWATKLLRGQSQKPSGWQHFLPANQKWLDEFDAQGKNREVFESPHRVQIGVWELWIEHDALQILQMGNRFSTCLSRGGCNSHSTITNALDANKLVVYARRDGQIQARQLWAVTDKWQLGGFHVYANLSESARQKSGVHLAFLEFAERFARDCGLELDSEREASVPELCGAQWYDDGLVSWEGLKAKPEEPTEGAAKSASTPKPCSSKAQRVIKISA